MSAERFNPVTAIASKQPELNPKPFKPEMRSDRLWYELQLARQQIGELREALQALIDSHAALVNSGDCGNWDVETEPEVMQARALLTRIESEKLT